MNERKEKEISFDKIRINEKRRMSKISEMKKNMMKGKKSYVNKKRKCQNSMIMFLWAQIPL